MNPLSIYTAASGVASYMQKNFTDQQRYNQQLIDQRNNWKMQNAYNSPAAQMARLKAAGLNPNLVYQQGGALTGAGEISSPSMPEAPIYDYQSVAQMALNTRLARADIDQKEASTRLTNAEALDREKQNGILDNTTIKGFSKLSSYQILDDEAKKFYSGLFGMTPEQVDNQSLRWFTYANDIKQMASSNSNARKMLDILDHEKDLVFQQAERAFITTALDNLNLHTEASKRGVSFSTDYNYRKEADLVFQSFLRQYKELKYQSSDFKHIFDSTNQAIGTLGSLIPRFHKGMFSDPYTRDQFYKGRWYHYEEPRR